MQLTLSFTTKKKIMIFFLYNGFFFYPKKNITYFILSKILVSAILFFFWGLCPYFSLLKFFIMKNKEHNKNIIFFVYTWNIISIEINKIDLVFSCSKNISLSMIIRTIFLNWIFVRINFLSLHFFGTKKIQMFFEY